LWRGTFYTTYTGSGWFAPNEETFTIQHGNDVSVPASSYDPAPVHGHSATYRATPASGFQGSLIWAPGVLTHVTGVHHSIAGVVRRPANSRLFVAHLPASYRVTSTITTRSPAVLQTANGSDPADPQWTQLPSTLPSEVVALARRITSTATDRYQQVRDIETYLRTHETYTLNSPVPAQGDDAVDDFLFRDHTGFCEQFASAEAVMLRGLGVPSRLVSGLAYGQRFGNERLYTAADAHAWVEVFYPGVGWSPSDPTAGAELAPNGPGHQSWLSRTVDRLTKNLPGGRIALLVIVVVLAIGGGFVLRRVRQTRGGRRRRVGKGGVIGPVLAAFHRMTRHANSPAPRAPTETAREYLGRVDPNGELTAALAALEQECYGPTPPPPAESDAAVASLTDAVRR
jgi:transglutaminase-like putative cysteine protease